MKQQTRAALVATVLVATPALSMAAENVITFNGKVIDQTCAVNVDGSDNKIVKLPNVGASQLAAAGSTAGLTPFKMNVTGCKSGTAISVNMVFSGAPITAEGTLENTATTNAATKVQLQLLNDATGNSPITLSSVSSVFAMTIPQGETSGSKEFAVRYRSADGGATVGDVSATVNYDITYN